MLRAVQLLSSISFLLLSFAVLAEDDRWSSERKTFVAAESALSRGNTVVFNSLMERLEKYPLYPYLRYKAVMRDPSDSKAIEDFLRRYGNSRYEYAVRNRYLDYLASRRNWEKYIQVYRQTRDSENRCNYFHALHQQGRVREAYAGARTMWLVGHSQSDACDPLFARWRASSDFTASDVWQRFDLSLREKNTRLARYLVRFLPDTDERHARRWLKIHDKPRAVSQLSATSESAPPGIQGKIFIHGIDRLASTDPHQALAIWRGRKGDFQIDPVDRVRIQKRLAMAHVFRRNPGAYALLAEIDDEYADVEVKQWRLRSALRNQDWPAVLDSFNRLDASDRSAPSWQYWQARALAALGRRNESSQIYSRVALDRSFHGFLAADQVGREYAFNDQPARVEPEQIENLEQAAEFQAVSEFRKLDRQYDARGQWWSAVGQLADDKLLAAAKLAQRWGWHQVAIFTISRAEYWDDLGLRFPLGYKDTVHKYAKHRGIPPEVIMGVIRQESAFDVKARSPVGARGLMQIMPGTGKLVARSLDEKWRSVSVLYDADANVRYGSKYLKDLLERFSGNLALAAAAYNAGPHRVQRWLPEDVDMPTDIWAELIPYKETRRYVAAVMAYTIIYRQRMGLDATLVSDYVSTVSSSSSRVSQQQRRDSRSQPNG